MLPKLGKSKDYDQHLFSFKGDQDTSACRIPVIPPMWSQENAQKPQSWPVFLSQNATKMEKNWHTVNKIFTVLNVISIGQHYKFQTIPAMRSPERSAKSKFEFRFNFGVHINDSKTLVVIKNEHCCSLDMHEMTQWSICAFLSSCSHFSI